MKSILLTAILATVGFASKVSVLSYTNQATPFNLGIDASYGFVKAFYDVNFGYGLEGSLDQGDQEGVMDAWVQGSLWSNADLYINVNILNLEEFNVKINTIPFHIIPLWASFYYTHPAAVFQGIVDEFAAALDFGYELHTGEIAAQYYMNSLVPKVSLSDFALGASSVAFPEQPGTTFASNANGVNGWDWNNDRTYAWVEEPFLEFDLLDYLITEGTVEIDNYASYLMIPLVGDGDITAAQ